jgi:hypothetical protein
MAILLGIYSILSSKYPYSSDRGNYVYRFVNKIEDPWTMGLNSLAEFLQIFTNDPNVLFFTISFLCLLLTLIAYRIFDEADPNAILLMSLSTYCIYSFYLLKQAPSIAFAAISIALFAKKKWLYSLVFLILAITFHEASYILLPLYIVLLGSKKRWVRITEYTFLFLSLVFFIRFSSVATNFINQWLPNISEQLNPYTDESGSIVESINIFTIFKGFPYYFITVYAFWKRSSLKYKIKNYDLFLTISVFSSAMILMSAYMYWMWRFAAYGYFPMFIFASLIIRELKGNERLIFKFVLISTLLFITFRYLYQMFFWHGGF